jgi:hypothetical protein
VKGWPNLHGLTLDRLTRRIMARVSTLLCLSIGHVEVFREVFLLLLRLCFMLRYIFQQKNTSVVVLGWMFVVITFGLETGLELGGVFLDGADDVYCCKSIRHGGPWLTGKELLTVWLALGHFEAKEESMHHFVHVDFAFLLEYLTFSLVVAICSSDIHVLASTLG